RYHATPTGCSAMTTSPPGPGPPIRLTTAKTPRARARSPAAPVHARASTPALTTRRSASTRPHGCAARWIPVPTRPTTAVSICTAVRLPAGRPTTCRAAERSGRADDAAVGPLDRREVTGATDVRLVREDRLHDVVAQREPAHRVHAVDRGDRLDLRLVRGQ